METQKLEDIHLEFLIIKKETSYVLVFVIVKKQSFVKVENNPTISFLVGKRPKRGDKGNGIRYIIA